MKKLFVLTTILALAFAACNNEDSTNNGNNNSNGSATLQINNQSSKELDQVSFRSVLFAKENADIIGTWTGSVVQGESGQANLTITDTAWSGSIVFDYWDETIGGQGNWTRNGNTLTLKGSAGSFNQLDGTAILSKDTLTVNFTMQFDAVTATLTSQNLQTTIKSSNSVTKTVEDGSGYVFFKLNSVDYYTKDVVVVEKNDKAIFTFTNNTLVVKSASGESKTLGSL